MRWENITERDSTLNIDGLDIYAHWSLGEGLPYFFPSGETPKFFPLLIQLRDDVNAKDFAEGKDLIEAEDLERWTSAIYVAPAYTDLPQELEGLRQARSVTAFATSTFFDIIKEPKNTRLRSAFKRIALSRPIRQQSLSMNSGSALLASELKVPTASAAPNMVIVGIIDDGIAFGHERFRDSSGATRIEYAWVQDGSPPSPPLFGYGYEIDKATIDQLIIQSTHASFFDEDEFYSLAQVGDFTRPDHKAIAWRAAHGTAVLDLATGANPGASPGWPIVCVQLPVATTATTSGATLAQPVIDGTWYILLKSLVIAFSMGSAPLPVVINLSYGFIAGPHDGTHEIESAIDELIDLWRTLFNVEVNVVIASGNSHLSRVHAQVGFQGPNDIARLPWRVLPDDRTPSYVEVWLPTRAAKFPSPLELSVVTPSGLASPLIGQPAAASYQLVSSSGDVLCEVSYRYIPPPTQRGVFLITLSPTMNLAATGWASASSVAPSGTWTIVLNNISVGATELCHAWIQRDDTPFGYPIVGRQSYFDDPAYLRFNEAGREIEDDEPSTLVKRAGTINAMATGGEPVVVGGLLRSELRPATYSSGGPVTPTAGSSTPSRDGPDVLTISDDSRVLTGVLAAGTHSGAVVSWSGTSVAAPMITRFLADELAAGGPGGRQAVCALATSDETSLPPPQPNAERGGCGRIRRPPLYPLRLT